LYGQIVNLAHKATPTTTLEQSYSSIVLSDIRTMENRLMNRKGRFVAVLI